MVWQTTAVRRIEAGSETSIVDSRDFGRCQWAVLGGALIGLLRLPMLTAAIRARRICPSRYAHQHAHLGVD